MKVRQIFPCIILLSLLFLMGRSMAAPDAPPTTFRITGDVAKAEDWSVPKLRQDLARHVQTLRYKLKGKQYSARVVPLLAVIQAAQPKFDPKSKHPEVRFLVLVQGRDGYTVAYSLGELMPNFGNRKVYVALEIDGKPLAEKEAPVRLLVPEDNQDAARWIYGITSITIMDSTKLKTEQ
jgi:hypothetical protein